MAKTVTQLPKFEGRDTIAAALTLHKTGNGLETAINLDPTVLHVGDVVELVVRAEVVKVIHETPKKGSGVIRKHQLDATVIRLVDSPEVRDLLDGQLDRIEAARPTVDDLDED